LPGGTVAAAWRLSTIDPLNDLAGGFAARSWRVGECSLPVRADVPFFQTDAGS
jgi:hypothetical protein